MKLPDVTELRALRKKLGISQSELSRRSGVSQSLIARLESGSVDAGYRKVSLLFSALDEARQKDVSVSEIMSHHVYGAASSETIEKAALKMKKYGVSQMPVFENRRIVGSISESTILNQIASGADTRDLSKRKIRSCIENPLPTVSPNTPVKTVSLLLETSPAVIVLEKSRVVGIATKADLLKMVHT
jgi:predicted transcriptional regulator